MVFFGGDDVLAYAQRLPDGGWLVTGHATEEQSRTRELAMRLASPNEPALAALESLLGGRPVIVLDTDEPAF